MGEVSKYLNDLHYIINGFEPIIPANGTPDHELLFVSANYLFTKKYQIAFDTASKIEPANLTNELKDLREFIILLSAGQIAQPGAVKDIVKKMVYLANQTQIYALHLEATKLALDNDMLEVARKIYDKTQKIYPADKLPFAYTNKHLQLLGFEIPKGDISINTPIDPNQSVQKPVFTIPKPTNSAISFDLPNPNEQLKPLHFQNIANKPAEPPKNDEPPFKIIFPAVAPINEPAPAVQQPMPKPAEAKQNDEPVFKIVMPMAPLNEPVNQPAMQQPMPKPAEAKQNDEPVFKIVMPGAPINEPAPAVQQPMPKPAEVKQNDEPVFKIVMPMAPLNEPAPVMQQPMPKPAEAKQNDEPVFKIVMPMAPLNEPAPVMQQPMPKPAEVKQNDEPVFKIVMPMAPLNEPAPAMQQSMPKPAEAKQNDEPVFKIVMPNIHEPFKSVAEPAKAQATPADYQFSPQINAAPRPDIKIVNTPNGALYTYFVY